MIMNFKNIKFVIIKKDFWFVFFCFLMLDVLWNYEWM